MGVAAMAPRTYVRRGRRHLLSGLAAVVIVLCYYRLLVLFEHPHDLFTGKPADQDVIPGHATDQDNRQDPSLQNDTSEKRSRPLHNGTDGSPTAATHTNLTQAQPDRGPSTSSSTRRFQNDTDTFRAHEQPDERISLVSRVCESQQPQIPGTVSTVFLYEAQKVAYCSTHKIASTYWIRIFRWLYNDTTFGHVASPLLLSKYDTHLAPFKRIRAHSLIRPSPKVRALIESSYRFLFTRDPYARLWSVYIDKFLLPDNYFWVHFSPRIKASIHQKSAPCMKVTFHEFLQYIVIVAAHETGQALDDHFRPVHYGCNPCQFRPDFIGHIETMREDSARVLRRMKLDLPELSSHHVEQEINMLVDFSFELVVRKHMQRVCVNDTDLERRLLKAFLYNGYLPPEKETWLAKQLPLGEDKFKRKVLELYHTSGQTSDRVREQRERYKLEAFQQIPRDLLLAVQKVFHWDFELFGYDPFPSGIFNKT